MDLAWFKIWLCIIVLPDVPAEAQAVSLTGSLLSHRIECISSMHDWVEVASDGFAAIFRKAEEAVASGTGFAPPDRPCPRGANTRLMHRSK
jgi:hypothetical protein